MPFYLLKKGFFSNKAKKSYDKICDQQPLIGVVFHIFKFDKLLIFNLPVFQPSHHRFVY